MDPGARRQAAQGLVTKGWSQRRACALIDLSRSSYHTVAQGRNDEPVQHAIALSNLTCQELYVSASPHPVVNSQSLAPPPNFSSLGPGTAHLQLNPFGRAFLAAIAPPAS